MQTTTRSVGGVAVLARECLVARHDLERSPVHERTLPLLWRQASSGGTFIRQDEDLFRCSRNIP